MASLIDLRTYKTRRTAGEENKNSSGGNLTIIEQFKDVPFEIKRVYYIHGNTGVVRGGHRHHKAVQGLICTHGEFKVYVNNGRKREIFLLSSPEKCLIIDPQDWHSFEAHSPDSLLLVLASNLYDESDYIDEDYNDEVVYEDLSRTNAPFFEDFKKEFATTLEKGWYILGENVKQFENEFANYLGAKHCAGLASGLDALTLGLKVFGFKKESEVLIASNAYIACVLSIIHNDLKPVFVEPALQTYNIDPSKIEEKINKNTVAIMPVHMYGNPCDMKKIMEIAKRYNLRVIEDCAQSHGAMCNNQKTGTFGDLGAFSFYPTKNLGALGDAGAIVAQDEDLIKKLKSLRNYGSTQKYYNDHIGHNSRLDEIQAAFLRVKLRRLDDVNEYKRRLADIYQKHLSDKFIKPIEQDGHYYVYHIYPIRHPKRDELKKFLLESGIKTEIHYPLAPHKQKAMEGILTGDYPISEEIHSTILSLPASYGHSESEIYRVVEAMNKFAQ